MMLSLVPPRPTGITTNSKALERQQRFALADLLRGTESMLEFARQENWNAVETLERARKADLVDYFRRNEQENSALLSEVISTLIALNDQIAQLVQQAKASADNDHGNMHRGKSMASNYLQIQDSI